LPNASGYRDVLLSIHHKGDRWADTASLIRGELHKFFTTRIGPVSEQVSLVCGLEDQVSCGRQRAAADAAATLDAPLFFLRGWIDGDEPAAGVELAVFIDRTDAW
jgi:hypothetical protein